VNSSFLRYSKNLTLSQSILPRLAFSETPPTGNAKITSFSPSLDAMRQWFGGRRMKCRAGPQQVGHLMAAAERVQHLRMARFEAPHALRRTPFTPAILTAKPARRVHSYTISRASAPTSYCRCFVANLDQKPNLATATRLSNHDRDALSKRTPTPANAI